MDEIAEIANIKTNMSAKEILLLKSQPQEANESLEEIPQFVRSGKKTVEDLTVLKTNIEDSVEEMSIVKSNMDDEIQKNEYNHDDLLKKSKKHALVFS